MASGHLEKTKTGWNIVIELDRDGEGKRKRIKKAHPGPRPQAQKELTKMLRELDTGTYVEPAKFTVAQYLQKWLDDYCKVNLAPSTFVSYERIIKKHIIPSLGYINLPKLQPLQIQSYYSKALQEGRRDGKGGLSARTVQYHHRVLREALQHAMKWQLVGRNVADSVEAPRSVRPGVQTLTPAQVHVLLKAVADHKDYALIYTAIYTGMRQGELLGLSWEDVKLKDKTITITRAIERLPKQGFTFKTPKNKKGRTITMPPTLIEVLKKHKKELAENRLLFGKGYNKMNLVFSNEKGNPQDATILTHRFKALVKRLGLPDIRFHDLRHTCASLLLSQGVHPKVVQERLGHETISVTLDTYSHVLPGLQEEAAQKIEKALGHQMGTKQRK
jgi:integrase